LIEIKPPRRELRFDWADMPLRLPLLNP